MEMRRSKRQVKDLSAIQEIVGACKVCRLAMQDQEGLYIVPMSPGAKWDGEKLTLYFHCAGEGRKISALRAAPRCAFEMDCDWRLTGEADDAAVGEGLLGHGDIVETAMMLHIAPDQVRMDRANIPHNKSIGNIRLLDLNRGEFEGASVYLNLRTKDVSSTGDLIEYGHTPGVDYTRSPKDATAEMGAEISAAVTDYACRFIDEFAKMAF